MLGAPPEMIGIAENGEIVMETPEMIEIEETMTMTMIMMAVITTIMTTILIITMRPATAAGR